MRFSFNTIIIIFLVLSLIIISYAIWKSTSVDDKKINMNVPYNCVGEDCKIECGILSPLTIRECKNIGQVCNDCKCDESGRLSGCMMCKESDPNNPEIRYALNAVGETQCTDPLEWDKDNGICVLKKGSFCLPTHVEEIDCNPYTGRKLLSYDSTSRAYEWTCVCKDDTKFSGSICNQINICGLEGSDRNPDNSLGGRGLVNKNNPDDYWNETSNWDPLAVDENQNYINSACKCKSNEFADDENLSCLPSDCFPGVSDPLNPQKQCKCTKGLVDCDQISTSYDPSIGAYYNGVCKRPSCVPDPCGGPKGLNGYYETVTDESGKPISGKCVCNPGYYLTKDPSYFGGYKCEKLCQNNGPCGDRGECVINDLDKSFTNFTILCNDQDEKNAGQCIGSGLFLITYVNGKTRYYLNYNSSDKSLKLECAQSRDSYFSFRLKNGKNISEKIKHGLISGSSYYMMIGDKYLIFNTDLTFDLVDEKNDKKERSLFLFTSDEGNKQASPIVTGTIFFDNINKYLSATNTFPPSLFYKSKTTTRESCINCKKGWQQDPLDTNQLCRKACEGAGYTVKYDYSENGSAGQGWLPYCVYSLGSSCGISNKPKLPPDYDDESYKVCCNGGTYTLDEKYIPTGNIAFPYFYYARKVLTCSDESSAPNKQNPNPTDNDNTKNHCD